MAGYWYEHFDEYVTSGAEERDFDAFPAAEPHATGRAPDGTLTQLSDGTQVQLSDLWRSQDVVLEFGSFT